MSVRRVWVRLMASCSMAMASWGCGSDAPASGGAGGVSGAAGSSSLAGTAGTPAGGAASAGGASGSGGSPAAGGTSGSGGSGEQCEQPPGLLRLHSVDALSYGNRGLGFANGSFYFFAPLELGEDHLYRASLATNEVTDLGEVASFGAILAGSDLIWFEGHIPDVSTSDLLSAPLDDLANPTLLGTTRTSLEYAADATNVYLAGIDPDEIWKVARTGGTAELVLATRAEGFASDGTDLYWLDSTVDQLRRMPIAGGEPENLAPTMAVNYIQMDGADVYFTDTRSLFKWSPGSNEAVELYSDPFDNPEAFTVSGGSVYFLHGSTTCGGLSRLSSAGGAPELLVEGFELPSWVGVNGSSVFVVDAYGVYRWEL